MFTQGRFGDSQIGPSMLCSPKRKEGKDKLESCQSLLVQFSCAVCPSVQHGGYQAWVKVVEHLDWVTWALGEHEHYTNVRSCNGCINVDSWSRQLWHMPGCCVP